MRVFWLCIGAALLCQGRQVLPGTNEREGHQQVTSNATEGLDACIQACLVQHSGPLECTHQALFDSDVTICVQTTCPTLSDLLAWENRYAERCGLEARDQGARDLIVAYILFGISSLCVAGRMLSRSRWLEGPGYWWDDWVMLAIYVISIEMAVCPVFSRTYWTGRDVIGVVTVHDVKQVLWWTYFSEPFYLISTLGTKLAWALLYLRIWEANTTFRKLCWITVGLLVASMVGYPIGAIGTFWPLKYYDGDSAIVRQNFFGIELIPALMAISVQIVLFDFWTLLLPVPQLIRLTGVSVKRRAAICIIILLGFAVTGCSIVRLTLILPLRDSRNPNWDFGHFGTWSKIELHLSMTSCNLPAIASLIHRMMLRRRRMNTIRCEDELQDSSGWTNSESLTIRTGQSIDIEDGSTLEVELVEDDRGKIVMRKKKRERPG